RFPEGDALPRLREFRFSDQVIWGVVVALIALVLPGVQWLHTIGSNLAAFFAILYAARGLGIVAAMLGAVGISGSFLLILMAAVTFLLVPKLVLGALAALGITDTWVDWRKLAVKAKNR